jgi:hypothetical protein
MVLWALLLHVQAYAPLLREWFMSFGGCYMCRHMRRHGFYHTWSCGWRGVLILEV